MENKGNRMCVPGVSPAERSRTTCLHKSAAALSKYRNVKRIPVARGRVGVFGNTVKTQSWKRAAAARVEHCPRRDKTGARPFLRLNGPTRGEKTEKNTTARTFCLLIVAPLPKGMPRGRG